MGISRKFRRKKQKKDYLVARKAIKDGSAWIDDDGGVHFIEHDEEAEKEFYDNLTSEFQKNIMESEMWEQMLEEFGEERAKELLTECKAESGYDKSSEFPETNCKKQC